MKTLQSKLTSCFSIYLPKPIRELLAVNYGDTISFLITGSEVRLSNGSSLPVCPLCLGKGSFRIEVATHDAPCFICKMSGVLVPMENSVFLVSGLRDRRFDFLQFGVDYERVCPNDDPVFSYIPLIKLTSPRYSPQELELSQDFLQLEVFRFFLKRRDDGTFGTIDGLFFDFMLSNLSTATFRDTLRAQVTTEPRPL